MNCSVKFLVPMVTGGRPAPGGRWLDGDRRSPPQDPHAPRHNATRPARTRFQVRGLTSGCRATGAAILERPARTAAVRSRHARHPVTQFGGLEVLDPVELPDPTLSDGELLIEVATAATDHADTHQTENSYLARPSCRSCRGGGG